MSYEGSSDFRTKRGRCVLDSKADELRLTSSWCSQFKRYYEGSKLIFVMMIVFFVYVLGTLLTADVRMLLAVLGIVVIIVVAGQLSNHVRGFTSTRQISFDSITAIEPIEGSWWTRPRFMVSYASNEAEKKRYVMLPSRYLSYTDEEFEKAKTLFHRYDLPLESN